MRVSYETCKLTTHRCACPCKRFQLSQVTYDTCQLKLCANFNLIFCFIYNNLLNNVNINLIPTIITPSNRGQKYESNGIKKLIFDQKSSYDSCKLSRRCGRGTDRRPCVSECKHRTTTAYDDDDDDDDISLLTHDKRKCYNNVKHCKPNTVNEKKSNQRKQNKLPCIKEDLQRLFGQVGRV